MGATRRGEAIYANHKDCFVVASLLLAMTVFIIVPAFADDTQSDAEQKAQAVHKLATSDMIYSQEEVKALYYQNVQIIDLLKEIRDLLQVRANETKGEDAAKAEKT